MCNQSDKFGHNFNGGICSECRKSQFPIKRIDPALVGFKLKFYSKKKESPNGMHQLVKDIVDEFGGSFPFLMKICKTVGEQQMREWFSEIKQADPKYPKIALLISNYKKFLKGIVWKS